MFNIVIGLIMAVAFIGMIFCAKKQHVNSIAKPAAVGLLLLVVICAISIMVHNMGDGDTSELIANEMVFSKASTYVLGKKLAELSPGGKVLYIVGSLDNPSERQTSMIESFKEGCGAGMDIKVVAPDIKKPEGEAAYPGADSFMFDVIKAKDFNKLLARNKGYNIIVTTIGLPSDAGNIALWKEFEKNPKKCPKLVFVNGEISKLAPLVKNGLVEAIVYYKPGADYEKPPPPDLKEAFDIRYLLITKSNIDQIIKQYPKIFSNK